jgi:hypothetical protein
MMITVVLAIPIIEGAGTEIREQTDCPKIVRDEVNWAEK